MEAASCSSSSCVKYIMLTVLATFISAILLHICLYFAFSYYVGEHYSNDLLGQRAAALAKIPEL